jgi:C1A family cysteine protease
VKHLPGAHKMRQSDVPLPYAVDWRLADPPILTSIKDQGMCGTCWAHAATEGIEVANALVTGDRLVLSQQQVASCAPSNGWGHGCWGGWPEAAFSYVIETGGINQEWVMGYQSYNGYSPNCSLLPKPQEQVPTQGIIGYNSVPANDADAFADALATIGPLAVGVDADPWTPYESGIFDGCIYNATTSLDHSVQAVGYGTDPALGARYWIIRNSWNALWGEQGYIRLLRQPEGVSEPCGIVNSPTMATNNQNVTVCGMCGVLVQGLYGIAEPVQ